MTYTMKIETQTPTATATEVITGLLEGDISEMRHAAKVNANAGDTVLITVVADQYL